MLLDFNPYFLADRRARLTVWENILLLGLSDPHKVFPLFLKEYTPGVFPNFTLPFSFPEVPGHSSGFFTMSRKCFWSYCYLAVDVKKATLPSPWHFPVSLQEFIPMAVSGSTALISLAAFLPWMPILAVIVAFAYLSSFLKDGFNKNLSYLKFQVTAGFHKS